MASFLRVARTSFCSFMRPLPHVCKPTKYISSLPSTIARTNRTFQGLTINLRCLHYKQRLWTGSGYVPDEDNVQHGVLDVGMDRADCLAPPNSSYRCVLDEVQWGMQKDFSPSGTFFDKKLERPRRVILEPTGILKIVDVNFKVLLQKGPYPGSSAPYQLCVEATPDLALYDGKGTKLWSAARDGV